MSTFLKYISDPVAKNAQKESLATSWDSLSAKVKLKQSKCKLVSFIVS